MEDNLYKVFSKNLEYWLSLRGKSQADMYKYMEVSSAVASDWCKGKKIPRADKLVKLSEWLMVDLSDLLEEKKREPDIKDKILFRLKDDSDFFETVNSIYDFDDNLYQKVKEYIQLLKK